MENLERLAELIKTKNSLDKEISELIGRPALLGHVGEFIASGIFGIDLHESASHKGSDGHFIDGSLSGRTVNIKWYGKREGLLDINPKGIPDYYLVLTGPKSNATSSRGSLRPWLIESVFLFDAHRLIETLRERGVKIGVATSVISQLWEGAEIYPEQRDEILILSDEQRGLLSLFR